MDMQTLAAAVALSKGSGGGGGSFAPDITDPQDGDTLVYNAAQQKWVNGAGGGQGGGGYLKVTRNSETGALDKTWAELNEAYENGVLIFVNYEYEEAGGPSKGQTAIAIAHGDEGDPYLVIENKVNGHFYLAETADDYPQDDT